MFNVDHFLLFGFLFLLSFLLTKRKQENYERNFWITTSLFIIAYTVIVGLRYGWGGDYYEYERCYNNIETLSFDYDLAYWKLYEFEHSLGLSFAENMMLSSLLIVVSYFYIVKAMKGDKYMLMCFLPATIMITTFALRQFHAIAYLNIAIGLILFSDNLLKEKKTAIIISALLIFLAYHTHGASLAYILPFIIFVFYRRNVKHIPHYVTITAFLASIVLSETITAIFNNTFLSLFENLTVNDHLQSYIDQADGRIFGDETVDKKTFGYSGAFLILYNVSQVCLLYVSGKALSIKPNRNVTYIYNIVVIALILQQIFFEQEVMRRILDPIAILYFIPLGYAINTLSEYRARKLKGYNLYLLCLSIALFRIYYQMYKFLTSFSIAGFVWDN